MSQLDDWNAAREWLRAHQATHGNDAWQLLCTVAGHTIVLRVRPVLANERAWLLVTAKLVQTFVSLEAAIAYNAALALGVLAIEDGVLVVRHSIALPCAAEDLEVSLKALAIEAACTHVDGVRTPSHPFSHLAD